MELSSLRMVTGAPRNQRLPLLPHQDPTMHSQPQGSRKGHPP
jgi:hypothetical protein